MRPSVGRSLGLAAALWLGAVACAGGTDVVAPAVAPAAGGGSTGEVDAGRRLATEANCVSCHSVDGSTGVGPTWQGLFGSTERLADGTEVVVDRAYLARSIRRPGLETVAGFDVVEMPAVELTASEVDALVAYIESIG